MLPLKIIYILAIPLLVMLHACTTSKNSMRSTSVSLPSSFEGSSDTLNMGKFKIEEIFKDTQLISLISTSLQNNQDILIASQRIEIAKANLRMSRGAFLPSLFFESSAGVKKYGDHTIDGVGNFDTNLSQNIPKDKRIPNPTPDYFIGFRSSWELDVWGKLRNQKRASYARFLASDKGRHLVITNLIADLATNYYTLLALDTELETIQKNKTLQQTAVETSKHLKEGGILNELAVSQLTAQLLNTQGLEIRTQQKIIETENRINILMGRFPQPVLRGKTLMDQELPTEIHAGIPSEMLTNRPDIQMAELNLAATKADVRAARAAFLPSFSITAYSGLNAFSSSVLFTNPGSLAFGLLGGLSAPLFNRNSIRANFKTAHANYNEAHYAYQKVIISGFSEVATSLKHLENLQKISNLKEQEVEVLQNGVTASNDLFLVGYASYLEVINAQRNVLDAQLDLTSTKRDQFISIINLYKALGGGWN
jgi:NodT family efflux transporter outer membrane factor (OMF) lipoprotein